MIEGKGIYMWVLHRCENGNMAAVVERLKEAGMTFVMPKIADGIYSYNVKPNDNWTHLPTLVNLCHKAGIKVIGWQYVYGSYPSAEGNRAVTELKKLPFDGFVVNAEHQYRDLPNNKTAVRTYMNIIKKSLPNMKLGLSSYRFPSLHFKFPFKEFLDYCDWNMPQIYWMKANHTVPAQVAQTIAEYKAYPSVPIIPTGAAFAEHGWKAVPADQKIFVDEVRKHGLQGCSWWEYYETFNLYPELGRAIIEAKWQGATPVEPQPEPPTGGKMKYIIEMLGNLRIRETPSVTGKETGFFAETGEIHYADKEENGWYHISTGWISGLTKYTRITVVEDPPEVEEPEPELTLEERVKRLEDAVFGGYEE